MFWTNLPKTRFPSQMPMFFSFGKVKCIFLKKELQRIWESYLERITKNLGKLPNIYPTPDWISVKCLCFPPACSHIYFKLPHKKITQHRYMRCFTYSFLAQFSAYPFLGQTTLFGQQRNYHKPTPCSHINCYQIQFDTHVDCNHHQIWPKKLCPRP